MTYAADMDPRPPVWVWIFVILFVAWIFARFYSGA